MYNPHTDSEILVNDKGNKGTRHRKNREFSATSDDFEEIILP